MPREIKLRWRLDLSARFSVREHVASGRAGDRFVGFAAEVLDIPLLEA